MNPLKSIKKIYLGIFNNLINKNMKNQILMISLLLMISLICKSQVSENRTFENFSALDVSSGISVEFTQSLIFSVKVESDNKELLKSMITKLNGNVLQVYITGSHRNVKKFNVYISSPHLNKIEISSGSSFKIKNILKEENLNIVMSSGVYFDGKLEVKKETKINLESGSSFNSDLITESLNLKANSGCVCKLSGKAEKANLFFSSGSSCNAIDFMTKQVNATANSASSLEIYVLEILEASVNSNSSVQYKGNPEVIKKISSQSSLIKI